MEVLPSFKLVFFKLLKTQGKIYARRKLKKLTSVPDEILEVGNWEGANEFLGYSEILQKTCGTNFLSEVVQGAPTNESLNGKKKD